MRLHFVTLRNYRVHHELELELDPARTLIGGPNESGKSTLVEAMHRAFFLRAKGNTEQHRAMMSTRHGGQPEVGVAFESGGVAYQLKKRFGSSGTTTLTSARSTALSGEAAETELARLLSVEAGITGRNALSQWAHLWVWQGQSGADPTGHANAQQDSLLKRLQQSGGAVAVQSELDGRVADEFAATLETIFTQAGKPRAGSDLELAETAATAAAEAHRLAAERRNQLQQAVRDFEEATQTITRAAADLRTVTEQLQGVSAKVERVTELRRREALEAHAAQSAREKHEALAEADIRIAQLRQKIQSGETALAPQTDQEQKLNEAFASARQQAERTLRELETAGVGTRRARQSRDLAVAWLNRFEKAERLAELSAKAEQVRVQEEGLARLHHDFARLPEIDSAKLKKLQKLEGDVTSAEAALQATAAGIELIASAEPVLVGGEAMAPGQSRILTEETEVAAGTSLRLRVRPGGGTSLSKAREHRQQTIQVLRQALDAHGLAMLAEAAEAVDRRQELEGRIKGTEATLRGLDAARLPEELAAARAAAASAEAEVIRRTEQVPAGVAPAAAAAAKLAVTECEQHLQEVEANETRCQAARNAAGEALAGAEKTLTQHRQDTVQQSRELDQLRAQLRLLLQLHGEDDARGRALAAAQVERSTADAQLAVTRKALTELQPDQLSQDATRLQRALEQHLRTRQDAETRRAVAQAALRSDGSEDPEEALALAKVRARSADEHLASVRRKAEAIRRLHQLFCDEQRALADRYTRPLADKIAGYLQCLFGAGAHAEVSFENHAFTGLRLVRPVGSGGAVAFDALSGGAREQVAAAVRLAVAEVLAADHSGCLPVVFDDAFAYSDPERVHTLQRMLDLAAARGLQVIVLTCNPSDYAALGARQILLRPDRSVPSPGVVSESPAEPTPEDETLTADEPSAAAVNPISAAAALPPALEEQRVQLLATLKELGGKAGNQSLRQTLGWDDATYDLVKDDLLSAGRLVSGRGRGGSVHLSPAN